MSCLEIFVFVWLESQHITNLCSVGFFVSRNDVFVHSRNYVFMPGVRSYVFSASYFEVSASSPRRLCVVSASVLSFLISFSCFTLFYTIFFILIDIFKFLLHFGF